MNKKLQEIKSSTKTKFYQIISKYYDEMNTRRQSGIFQFEEDSSSRNVEGVGNVYHEVLLLMQFSQTKLQVKNMVINYYDLYYTVIKNRDDKQILNENEYEKKYVNFNGFFYS